MKNRNSENSESVYFVSDAHLAMNSTDNEELLVNFIDTIKGKASHLYILGDLFDFWFEYKHAVPAAYFKVLSCLHNLSKSGVKVIYLPGNHDFWMGDYLQRQVGITLAGDSLDVEHQGKKIHLTHGDGLAYGDSGYRFMKKVFRFKPNIWLYKLLPVDWAYKLALRTSGASREHTSGKGKDMQGYYDYAKTKLQANFDTVIMGHTHHPEIKAIDNGLYINSGDWIEHYSYVVLEGGKFELRYFKPGFSD